LGDPRSVAFLTPSRGFWVSREFHRSSLNTQALLASRGVPHGFVDISGDMYPDKVRSKLATIFLEDFSDAENLFFLDDDVGWPAEAVLRFLERDEDLIAGVYPKKPSGSIAVAASALPPKWAANVLEFPVELWRDADGGYEERDGLLRARRVVPAGFLRVRRAALERYASVYDETFTDIMPDGSRRRFRWLFDHGLSEDGEYLGEDVAFAARWIGLGLGAWVDPSIEFTHRGSHAWRARLSDHLAPSRDGQREKSTGKPDDH
jgi:hypothetical protein